MRVEGRSLPGWEGGDDVVEALNVASKFLSDQSDNLGITISDLALRRVFPYWAPLSATSLFIAHFHVYA